MGQNMNNKKTPYDNLSHINPYCSYFDNFLYNCSALKSDGENIYFVIKLCIIYSFWQIIFTVLCWKVAHCNLDRCQNVPKKNWTPVIWVLFNFVYKQPYIKIIKV